MKQKAIGVCVAVCAAVLVAACGSSSKTTTSASAGSSSSASSTSGPFTVLFDADTTGPLKTYGQQDLNGLKAVVAYLNSKGGVDGHKITLATVSSNGDPATAVSQLLSYLSSHPKPDFVFAGTAGDEVSAMIPVVKKDGLLAASVNDGSDQCATNSQTSCPTFFAVSAPTVVPQEGVANFFKKKRVKKVGLLAENEAFTQTEAPALTSALEKLGISAVTVQFPSTATSLATQMSQLKADGVGGVYVEALGAPAGYAASARAQLGWNVPLVFDVAASSVDLTTLASASQLTDSYESIFRTNDASESIPGVKALMQYGAKAGGVGGALPVDVAAFPWDDLLVVAAGAEEAHSISATAIMSAIVAHPTTNPLLALSSKVAFSASSHENLAATPTQYAPVVPVGPIKNGQVQPPKS